MTDVPRPALTEVNAHLAWLGAEGLRHVIHVIYQHVGQTVITDADGVPMQDGPAMPQFCAAAKCIHRWTHLRFDDTQDTLDGTIADEQIYQEVLMDEWMRSGGSLRPPPRAESRKAASLCSRAQACVGLSLPKPKAVLVGLDEYRNYEDIKRAALYREELEDAKKN